MVSVLRVPVVAGVAGGVGTSTVAAALHGRDAGRVGHTGADVLVCRGSVESLHSAGACVEALAMPGAVLAVTADGPLPTRGPLPAVLEWVEPRFAAVVVLPHVRRWRELADPVAEAAALLAQSVESLPLALHRYVAALRVLAAAVAGSGRLREPDRDGGDPTTGDSTPALRTPALGTLALRTPAPGARRAVLIVTPVAPRTVAPVPARHCRPARVIPFVPVPVPVRLATVPDDLDDAGLEALHAAPRVPIRVAADLVDAGR